MLIPGATNKYGGNTDAPPATRARNLVARGHEIPAAPNLTSSHSLEIRVRQRLATKIANLGPNSSRRPNSRSQAQSCRAASPKSPQAGLRELASCCVGDRETFNRADAGILRHEAAHPSDRPVFSLRARPLGSSGGEHFAGWDGTLWRARVLVRRVRFGRPEFRGLVPRNSERGCRRCDPYLPPYFLVARLAVGCANRCC